MGQHTSESNLAACFAVPVPWVTTGDPVRPYSGKLGAETWTIQVNSFPDNHLYTLLINGKEQESFDEWPASWLRPPAGHRGNGAPPPPGGNDVERLFADLAARVLELRPHEDIAPLEKAFHFAWARHKDQVRASGEPYMIHPLMVTRQLAEMHLDMVGLVTGLLHDVVEDTTATLAEIKKEFGDEVAHCVDGVTKLSKLNLASREERQAESVRKMLLAMVNDIRVIIVKLADRLHNMRTLQFLSLIHI